MVKLSCLPESALRIAASRLPLGGVRRREPLSIGQKRLICSTFAVRKAGSADRTCGVRRCLIPIDAQQSPAVTIAAHCFALGKRRQDVSDGRSLGRGAAPHHVRRHRGELLVMVGPSGSGKTTLLNIMGGLDSPTVGQRLVPRPRPDHCLGPRADALSPRDRSASSFSSTTSCPT